MAQVTVPMQMMNNNINIIDTNYIKNLLNKADAVLEDKEEIAIDDMAEETRKDLIEEIAKEAVESAKAEGAKKEIPERLPEEELLEMVQNKIEIIKNLEGISIEKIGLWLWIDGNTIAVKEELKAAGFKYAKNKKMWYYNPDATYRKKSRKQFTKEDLENKYGFDKIK